MRLKLVSSILIVMALLISVGCGGGAHNTPPVVAISAVSPASPTVRPGQTQQFNATVTGSSNTTVVWTLGSGAQGTISSSGLYTAPAPPTIASGSTTATDTVIATAQTDTTKSTNTSVTLIALQSLTISPRGPALTLPGTAGSSVALTAMGTFSDGTKHDWTVQSSWSSDATSVATVSASNTGTTVNAVAVGVATITASDMFGSGQSNTTAVNVTSLAMTNANLKGQYAFTLTHAGQRGQAYTTGSFTADGNGNITAGEEDLNAPVGGTSGAIPIQTSGSSYSVYPDGRGTLTLNLGGTRGSDTYSFVLSTATNGSGASIKGRVIRSDSGAVAVGTLELQDNTTFATALTTGSYAVLLGGMDGTVHVSGCTSNCIQNPIALAGQFATGTPLSGFMDVNDNGTNSAAQAFTATITAADGNGRGTLQLPGPSPVSSSTLNFAYYVVSAARVLLIQTDMQGATYPTIPALAGTAESQATPGAFTAADIAGEDFVFLVQRSATDGLFGAVGQWEFSAASPGTLTGEMDFSNANGTTSTVTITSSGTSYTVGSNGRGTVVVSSTRSYAFYLISGGATGAGKMYVVDTSGSSQKGFAGVAEQQTLSASAPSGTLDFSMGQLATKGNDSTYSGQIVTTIPSAIVDSNVATNCPPGSTSGVGGCLITELASTAANTLNPPDGNGRGTATLDMQVPAESFVYYLVNLNKIVVFGKTSTQTNYQPIDGVIETQ